MTFVFSTSVRVLYMLQVLKAWKPMDNVWQQLVNTRHASLSQPTEIDSIKAYGQKATCAWRKQSHWHKSLKKWENAEHKIHAGFYLQNFFEYDFLNSNHIAYLPLPVALHNLHFQILAGPYRGTRHVELTMREHCFTQINANSVRRLPLSLVYGQN